MRTPAYSSLIVALLISVVAVVFAFQNDGAISVQFLRWGTTGSIATILLVTFALGVGAATLALLPTLIRAVHNATASRREVKRIVKKLEDEKAHEQKLVEEVAKARGAAEQAEHEAQQAREDHQPK